jgi:hypothetical protein
MLPDFLSDISISVNSLPITLDNVVAHGVLWQVADGCLLLNVPAVARYLVETGGSITIEPTQDAPALSVDYFLGMLPLASLLYQRGMLAFHAAALSNGEIAILLAGNSGSGKSTLLTALVQRGWRMLADDLAIIGLDELGKPVVYPTNPEIALWAESLTNLGIVSDSLPSCDANRRIYSLPESFDATPRPLSGIYRLNVHSKPDVEYVDLIGSACFNTIGTILYNSHVADALCNKQDYLRCVASIAQTVKYRDLLRPRGVWSVEALIKQVLNSSRDYL